MTENTQDWERNMEMAPSRSSKVTVHITGTEFETLVAVYEQLGGDTRTLAPLWEPSLQSNDGISQTVRAVLSDEIDASDFEPIPSPESSDDRLARLEVDLPHSEIRSLEGNVSLSDNGDESHPRLKNDSQASKKLRRGVIRPFCEEVTE